MEDSEVAAEALAEAAVHEDFNAYIQEISMKKFIILFCILIAAFLLLLNLGGCKKEKTNVKPLYIHEV